MKGAVCYLHLVKLESPTVTLPMFFPSSLAFVDSYSHISLSSLRGEPLDLVEGGGGVGHKH